MAPLTWRNVDAPDISSAARILNQAASQFGSGMDSVSGSLKDIRGMQRRNRSADAMIPLGDITGEANVAEQQAAVLGQIDPRDMTEQLQQLYMGARGMGQGFDSTRATTEGKRASTAATRASSARAAENHRRGIAAEEALAAAAGDIVMSREQAAAAGNPQMGMDTGILNSRLDLNGVPEGGFPVREDGSEVLGPTKQAAGSAPRVSTGPDQKAKTLSRIIEENPGIPVDKALAMFEGNVDLYDSSQDQYNQNDREVLANAEGQYGFDQRVQADEQAAADEAEDERLRAQAYDAVRPLVGSMPPDPNEFARSVRADDGNYIPKGKTREEREAIIAEATRVREEDAELFALPSADSVIFGDTADAYMNQTNASIDFMGGTDQGARVLAEAFTGSAENPGTVYDNYVEGVGEDGTILDRSQFMNVTRDLAGEFNITQGQVAKMALGMIKNGNFLNGEERIDGSALKAALKSAMGSRDNVANIQERASNLEKIKTQMGTLTDKRQELIATREYWSAPDRDPATAQARLTSIEEQLAANLIKMETVSGRAVKQAEDWENSLGLGGDDTTSGSDEDLSAADELMRNLMGTGEVTTRALPPVDRTVPFNGRAVNTESSAFERSVDSILRDGGIQETLESVANDLRGRFGTVANVGNRIGEVFQPRAEAEVSAEERKIGTAASNWYDSKEAREFFVRNPQVLERIESKELDPIELWQRIESRK